MAQVSSTVQDQRNETKPAKRLGPGWRARLEDVAADVLQHKAHGTFPQAPDIMTMDAALYTCPENFEREKQRIFQRMPLVLGASCELAAPGSYKVMEIAGIPVLVVRARDGTARAFLNSCPHRASPIASGCGTAARFTCPYHGWTFDQTGSLIGVASADDFGAIDKASLGLTPFPTTERGGLIWSILDPKSPFDPADLLADIDGALDGFGLENWTFVETRELHGANWKLAFDAHLEFYHIPVLHRETFGPDRSNRALYYYDGPHQRLISPRTRTDIPPAHDMIALEAVPAGNEGTEALMAGEWILFPATSINIFYPGGTRGIFLSQVFPGRTVGESVTVQSYLSSSAPDEAARAQIHALCNHLSKAVGTEDLPTSFRQQEALGTGMQDKVLFGRNEGGLQHFHRWIAKLVETEDADLPDVLAASMRSG